jgi:putative tryptophan/tyrosine transport system substrate-binding protein
MLLLSRLPWQQHPRLPVQLVLRRILTFMNFYRKVIVGLAARHRLPSMFGFRESVEDGGLMSYGPNLREEFRRAASYVAKILKGAKPSDLPIQEPMTLELVINMKTAKVLGLTVPPSVLLRANEVIR